MTLNLPEGEMTALNEVAEILGETKTTIVRKALKAYRKSKAISKIIDNNKDEIK